MNKKQEAKLEEVYEVCPTLAEMHRLKEDFRDIFDKSKSWTDETLKLLEWMKKSSTLFNSVCGTIKRWFGEITSYFELSITNGIVEGINNKLKLIKRLGYGFRNFDIVLSSKTEAFRFWIVEYNLGVNSFT